MNISKLFPLKKMSYIFGLIGKMVKFAIEKRSSYILYIY